MAVGLIWMVVDVMGMEPTRYRASDGRQIVTVSTGYAYVGPLDHELKVGDEVYVPAAFWLGSSAAPQLVRVTALGTSYEGGLVSCWPKRQSKDGLYD